MNERVTNEFALAASMCNILAPLCPRKCPFYGKDDCPVDPGDRDQFKALGAAVVEARKERDSARRTLEDHGPEGHNVTNQQYLHTVEQFIELRTRLTALEELATAVEADIDAGRPLEYNVEHLRDELIRAREALGILPEQDQEKEVPHVD
jgi:hypothetical protein